MNMYKNLERKDEYIVKKKNEIKIPKSSSNIIVARCTGSQELEV